VHGDLVNRLLVRVVGHVRCDLVEHPHQACGVTRRCTDPVRANACSAVFGVAGVCPGAIGAANVCPAVIGAADL
jgi:hypothetical protein